MGGSSTISISETKAEALTLQSSAYGVTVPVLGGQNRIAGNLLYYGDFRAIPKTETQGGKGGGGKTKTTTYTYAVNVLMGIAHGPVGAVSCIWVDKRVYKGGWSKDKVASALEVFTVPESGPMTYTLAQGATALAEPVIKAHQSLYRDGNREFKPGMALTVGTHYTVDGNVVTVISEWMRGYQLRAEYQYGIGDPDLTPLQQIGATLVRGRISQAAPAWMTAIHPDQARTYPGLAYIHAQDYDLGSSTSVDNHSFELQGWGAYSVDPASPDCSPAAFTRYVLTHTRFGARMPAATVDTETWETYCAAAGLLMSPVLKEQQRAADFVEEMARLTNAAPVWSYDTLRVVPYGDVQLTRNGVTYTPVVTPVYDLDDDCWLADEGEDPLEWETKQPSDRYNVVRVEFADRTNYYNRCIAEARDDADIAVNGERLMDTVVCTWICDGEVARLVAQLILQRSLLVTGTGRLRLPWAYCLLEPMDLLTITDPALGFVKLPVRVTAVSENEDGDLEVEVEDFPLGVADAARYQAQPAAGFLHDYGVAPGPIAPPAIFEAPVERTTTGLEVYAAVRGTSANWGGCRMWVSLDGTSYKEAAIVYGASRYGLLTGPVSGGNLPVQTSGQLVTASADDAAALETLCYVGGASPEYLAYTTATLTGAGAYTLAGLVRGAYGTAATPHAASDAFVRVDDRIGKSGPLSLDLIGRQIWLKFTSFNIYQAAEESIADVTAYAYTITGAMAQLPPSQPTGLAYTQEPFGVRVKCTANPEPDIAGYQWRVGATWVSARVLDELGGTSYALEVQAIGSLVLWVAAVDKLGNVSTPASLPVTVSGPTIASIGATIDGADLVLSYVGAPGAFAVGSYEIAWGDAYVSATPIAEILTTTHRIPVSWGGARRLWVTPIDVRGGRGAPRSIDINIAAPGAPASGRAEVVDNNVNLYWEPPTTGSLPIANYRVRRGATSIGTNGPSTFASIFEQLAGTYSYPVEAVDTAGNVGPARVITATVSSPPDYVLRANVDVDLSTMTLAGMYLDEDGSVYGPTLGQTLAQRFSSRGWSTFQDQINAGYPLAFQPGGTSGSATSTIDYGAVLPATTITATPTIETIAGSLSVACQISYKAAAGDPWIDAPAGTQAMAAGFRYVRVALTWTGAGGDDLGVLRSLNVRLGVKKRTDFGAFTALATDVGGTFVPFSVAFLSVTGIKVTASGLAPALAQYIFDGTPNPTGFRVIALNPTTGARITASGSWDANGY